MKNYFRYTFGLVLLVALMMLGLKYLPAESVEEAGLKPVNILADLDRGNTVEELEGLDAEAGAGIRQGGYSVRSVTGYDRLDRRRQQPFGQHDFRRAGAGFAGGFGRRRPGTGRYGICRPCTDGERRSGPGLFSGRSDDADFHG